MKKLFFLIAIILLVSCNSKDKKPLIGKTAYQQEMNANFKDASKTPLKPNDLKKFKGLDFYPVDSSLIVIAKLTKTPNAPIFEFSTTGERTPLYRSYGILYFTINGVASKLTVYKNMDPSLEPEYEDYLFLPFTDFTTGNSSYAGGRYIDLRTGDETKEGTMKLNFNEAYNPYCAYNEKYSCPVVPEENHISTEIKAGVMAFKK